MNAKYGDRYESFSAGTEVTRVHPMAIEVVREIGIDISRHRSKLTDEIFGKDNETVVAVCDSANKACPFFPGPKEVFHQSYPVPSAFTGSEEKIRAESRVVRSAIIKGIDAVFG